MGPSEEARQALEHQRPRVAIVSSAEIAEQGGTLDAGYWVNRQPGESAPQYRRRRQAEDCERRAKGHERIAAQLREEAAQLRGATDG